MLENRSATSATTAPADAPIDAGPKPWWRTWWLPAIVIVAIYVAGYASLISRHTAVPYFDQQNYVQKTYSLAEQWHNAHSLMERLNPARYLGTEPAARPPLMMILPAMLWRGHATPHEMAYVWLIERTLFLLLGICVLARIVRDHRWIPAALCAILATSYFWELDPQLYMMDVPFACAALCSVALVGYAMQRRTMRADLLAAAGTLALFLLKSQGLLYMFPFMGMLAIERLVHEVRTFRSVSGPAARRRRTIALMQWLSVNILLIAALCYLLTGPYGRAIRLQYAWGQQGYWNTIVTWEFVRYVAAGLLPGWILIALALAAARKIWWKSSDTPEVPHARWLVATLAISLTSWLTFALFLTYTIDTRIIWSVTPLLLCVAMILLCRWRAMATPVTAIAAALFLLSCSVALFGIPSPTLALPLTGNPLQRQYPVPEVGERELVRRVEQHVRTGQFAVPAHQGVTVTVVTCGEYLDYAGMLLAARWQNGDQWSPTDYEQFPFGDDGFDIAYEFDFQRSPWFITRLDAPPSGISPRSLVNMHAMESLIADPASPIAPHFKRCDTVPIHVPIDDALPLRSDGQPRHDRAAIWRLRWPLTPREFRDSLAYILPQYENAPGKAYLQQQIARFDEILKQGSGVNIVSEAQIAALTDVTVRDVKFDDGLVLKAARLISQNDGAMNSGITLDIYWQATADLTLDGNRFIHLLNAAGKILHQGDGPLDSTHGKVRAGTCWHDTARFAPEEMTDVATIGIGIQSANGTLAAISSQHGGSLDWNNQRLLIPANLAKPPPL